MTLHSVWQIEGVLETIAPMHIGDGASRTHPVRRGDEEVKVEISTAAKTADGHGLIPGSALKGVLRSAFPEDDPMARELFGIQERGGLVQFLDAYSENPVAWNSEVLGRTAIDPVSGAAQDHLLFNLELIPEKTKFLVRIRGRAAGDWREQVLFLQRGLHEFTQEKIRLGSCESNQWGRCRWRLDAVRVMDVEAIRKWLTDPEPIDRALGRLDDRKTELGLISAPKTPSGRTLRILLRFDGHHFLVNDPGKVKPKKGKKDDESHAHVARRRDGKLMLPAESFRGVLSHQAARIEQTRGGTGKREPVRRDRHENLPESINAVTRLFGGAGWESVLEISDFIQTDSGENSTVQEFLAVDRFTGGGAEERKFDAEGGWQPKLQGEIKVDIERLVALGNTKASLGLLALTLRDLIEGDLSFGWGSAKGYGWATVDTEGIPAVQWIEEKLTGWAPGSVREWIGEWEKEVSSHA